VSDKNSNVFDSAVEKFRKTADETARTIEPGEAALFVYLSNDAIDIIGAVLDAYPRDDLLSSLVWFDFTAVLQQLFGMGFDFWCGRYAEVGRGLRFVWESIFRAFYADCYLILNPSANDPPGQSLDEKIPWLDQRRLDWNTLILPVLCHMFQAWSEAERSDQFQPVWKRLNAVVHPSADWRLSGVGESARHVWFHFDEGLARQLLADASEVFALIWLAVLQCFPAAVPALVADPETFRGCPQLRAVLESVS
jgi:hypothetical protein